MTRRLTFIVVFSLVCAGGRAHAQTAAGTDLVSTIMAIERGAMDRWCRGDPSGYIDIFDSDVTVLDARTERTLSGINEVAAYYEPIRGKVSIPRYEFVRPRVQVAGDAAILTYNFVSYSESNQVVSRWNFTQVYRRAGPTWKVLHSHASYTLGRPADKR